MFTCCEPMHARSPGSGSTFRMAGSTACSARSACPSCRIGSVFQRTFEMLEPGGRYAAMDLYIEPGRGPLSRALDLGYRVVARADHSRRFWLPLQRQCADYEERVFPFLGE